jgi:hypothetical protein
MYLKQDIVIIDWFIFLSNTQFLPVQWIVIASQYLVINHIKIILQDQPCKSDSDIYHVIIDLPSKL